ncbi:hypothetical protein [Pontibacterium sp.]|uniref:COG4648 family protein n=1 Tax=Pontibacterium sp. TaxID=2036026 RepID=UPI003516ED2A
MVSIVLKILAVSLTISYPFLIYWGLQKYDAGMLLPVLLILLALRWITGGALAERKLVMATFIGLAVIVMVGGEKLGLKFYPVIMNLGFLILFVSSLFSSQTVIERFARLKEPDLPEAGVLYTRKVTWAWSIFFLMNGTIAAVTAVWANDQVWMLYNGLISYLLIALLACGEWLVRQRIRRG